MKITVSKIQKEVIEIKTPAYFKEGSSFIKIVDENSFIKLHSKMITVWEKKDYCFESDVQDFINNYNTSTDAEFMNAYNNVMSSISPLVNSAKCITQQA